MLNRLPLLLHERRCGAILTNKTMEKKESKLGAALGSKINLIGSIAYAIEDQKDFSFLVKMAILYNHMK